MILYVQEQGAMVQKRNNGIEVRKQGALLYKIPFIGLERLVVFGQVQITTQALQALSEQGIDILYMTRGGRIVFSLNSPGSDNVFLRLAQSQKYLDDTFKLQFAVQIVIEKLKSQVQYIKTNRWTEDFDWRSRSDRIEELLRDIETKTSIDEIRGVEGLGSRLYFECFGARSTHMPFHGRSRRPAGDEVNALLNLSYTFLCNECIAALEGCGFDPAIGYMHGLVYGRKSLALDIMEVFRVDVVDRLVLRLLNWSMLTEKHFVQDPIIGYRLTKEAFPIFIEQYEKHISGGTPDYRKEILRVCRNLQRAILHDKTFTVSPVTGGQTP